MKPELWQGISMVIDKLNDKAYARVFWLIAACIVPFGFAALVTAIAQLLQVL